MKKSNASYKLLIFLFITFAILANTISDVKADTFSVTKNASAVYFTNNSHSAVFTLKRNGNDISYGVRNAYCLQARYENTNIDSIMTLDSSKDSTYYYTTSNGDKLPLRAILYYSYGAPGWNTHSSDLTTYYTNHFSGKKSLTANVYHTISATVLSYAFVNRTAGSGINVKCKYNTGDGYSGTDTACDWNLYYTSSNHVDSTVNGWKSDIKTLLDTMYTYYNADKAVLGTNFATNFIGYYTSDADGQDLAAWEYVEKVYIKVKKSYSPSESTARAFRLYEAGSNGECTTVADSATEISSSIREGNTNTYYLGWSSTTGPTLDLNKTYCVWENGEKNGKLKLSSGKSYLVDYKVGSSSVKQTNAGGYNFGKITTSSLSTDSTGLRYVTLTTTNTQIQGYVELTKVHSPSESTSRTFRIYECTTLDSNNKCTAYSTPYIDEQTTGSNGKAYLGWDSTNSVGMLELGKTYVIWEVGDGSGGTLDKNYITTYSNSVTIDGYKLAQVKVNENSTSYNNKTRYVTATVTNTKKKGYVEIHKTHSPAETTSRSFNIYKCTSVDSNGKCTAKGSVLYTATSNSNGIAYLGWDTTNNEALLDLDQDYVIREVGAESGGTLTDNYITSYTNQVTIGNTNYGQVKITANSSDYNDVARYETFDVTNTKKKGVIQIQKTHSPAESTSRTFRLYKCANYIAPGVCGSVTGSLASATTNSSGVATFGWDSVNQVGTLDLDTEYFIWEVGDGLGGDLDDNYITSYSNQKIVDGFNYASVTISSSSSAQYQGRAKYETATITNTRVFGHIEIQKQYSGGSGTSFFNPRRFAYRVCKVENGVESSTCTTVYTNNTGKATYGLTNSLPTLDSGSVYRIHEVMNSNTNNVQLYTYSSGTYSAMSELSSNFIAMHPVYTTGYDYEEVTINTTGTDASTSINHVDVTNSDTTEYGYLEVQKLISGSTTVDFTHAHFAFDICPVVGGVEQNCTTIYTDNTGKATFGTGTGTGELTLNSVYHIKEKVDGSNHAVLYPTSTGGTPLAATSQYYVPLLPVYPTGQNYEETTITNVGYNPVNVSQVTNQEDGTPDYGYIRIKKTYSGSSSQFYTKYHFGYKVCKVVNGIESQACTTVYTNNSGYAYYGRTTLELGEVYRIREIVDSSNNHAILYKNSSGSGTYLPSSSDYMALIPNYSTANDYEEVTITHVGSNPVNIAQVSNTLNQGYIEINKTVSNNSNINFNTYHFGYKVCEVVNGVESQACSYVYTDNTGKVTFGQTTLRYGSVYRIREVVDTNNYAVLYTNDSGTATIDVNNANYKSIKPTYPNNQDYEEVTVTNVGSNPVNIATVTNTEEKGYIEVTKAHNPTETTTRTFNLYSCSTITNNTCTAVGSLIDTTSTNTNQKYYLGKSGNAGNLTIGKTYLVWESGDEAGQTLRDNYITSYTNEVTINGKKYSQVTLSATSSSDSNSVKYTTSTVTNTKRYGYLVITKTHVPSESTVRSFGVYNVGTSGDCTTIGTEVTQGWNYNTSQMENLTTSRSENTYYIGKLDNTNGMLELNKTYCVREKNVSGVLDDYIVSYSPNETTASDNLKSAEVTLNQVDGNNIYYTTVDVTNTKKYGYVGVQKTSTNSNISYSNYYFQYDVKDANNNPITTVCTDSTGIATYGKNGNDGTLAKNTTYIFEEETDIDGYAVVYDSDACNNEVNINTDSNKPMVKPVNNNVSVTVTNIGTGTLGENISNYPNTEEYGYAVVRKQTTPSGTSITYSNYHFKYTVKQGNTIEGSACTNNSGNAIFGRDGSGNGLLRLNSTHTFIEETDNDGYAVVYQDANCSSLVPSSDTNKPMVKPVYASRNVTIENIGLQTDGANSKTYPNKFYGYVGVQKQTTDSSISFTNNHFLYDVTDSRDNVLDTICTDNTGLVTYGQDSTGNGTLEKGTVIKFKEKTDNDGYALVYTDTTCNTPVTNNPYVNPASASVSVTVTNVGGMTAGENISNYPNDRYYGYIEVQKTSEPTGTSIDYTKNFFKYEVYDSTNTLVDTICTNNTGKATYGKDTNGDGTLTKNSTYTFVEETASNNYAVVYKNDDCSQLSDYTDKVMVKPVNNNISVTVTNIGSQGNGANTGTYPNKHYGYIEVQKNTSDLTFDYQNNHFKYKVYDSSNTLLGTICTDNTGKATYGKDSNNNITLEKNSTYTFEEELDSNNYAAVYGTKACNTPAQNNPMLKPVNSTISVTVNNVGNVATGGNFGQYDNKYLGYVGVQKTVANSSVTYTTYHFRYTVKDSSDAVVGYACTDDTGLAIYGKDALGNGTLDKNSAYTFEEELDNNGNAIIYDSASCNSPSLDPSAPVIQPANPSVTVNVDDVGTLSAGENISNYPNNKYFGYAEVQKVLSPGDMIINYQTYHFRYEVKDSNNQVVDYICTNDSGYATYGKVLNDGVLEKNSTYTFEEEIDSDGYAVVYGSGCSSQVPSSDANRPYVKPVNNSISITISNVGSNTSGLNSGTYTNKMYGYAEVQKESQPTGTTINYQSYHFRYEVKDSNNQVVGYVCTDSTGKATYGKDSNGNGTLEKNSTYIFKEAYDSDGYAIVYQDTDCLTPVSSSDTNRPMVKPTINDTTITISNVGNLTNGANTSNYPNKQYGYVGVQKESQPTGTTIDYQAYHFRYEVKDSSSQIVGYACTDNTGLATYGQDSTENGTLEKNSTYTFKEDVDSDGYAFIYDSGCSNVISTNKPMVKPTINNKTVTVTNVGGLTNGANIENYPNKQYGYVGVQKSTPGTTIDFNTYHFKYEVKDSSDILVDTVCTDSTGLATYGQDSTGNGTLEKNSTYTFKEDVDNSGYAVVYGAGCQTPISSTDTNRPIVKPASATVNVTVTNVGSMTDGAKISTFSNGFGNCLSIKKTDSLTSSELQGAVFELYTDNTCQTTTGRTATTDQSGIAKFEQLSGTTYYAKEITPVTGYTVSNPNNCTQVIAEQNTTTSSTCKLNTITNDALYIGFYKQKEDGTPLTSATFKVKNESTNKYIQVSGTYNNCYAYSGETTDASQGSTLSVNDMTSGLYCIAKLPSGTYTAEEQSTGDDGYWFNNGTISGLTTSTTINPVQGDGSNSIKNNPYVLTFFKTKEDNTGMSNATFVLKESSSNSYIKTNGTSSVSQYNGCYIYNGTTTNVNEAGILTSDTNGRVCVIRIPNNKNYNVIEKTSGDNDYGVNENITLELTPTTSIETKSNNNTVIDYPYYINFYKVDENDTPMENTKFIVKNSSDNYIIASNPDSSRTNYKDCYIYTGTTPTTSAATEFITNASGEVCIVKITNDTYTAIETDTGSTSYYVDPNNNTISNISVKTIPADESRTPITDPNSLKLVNYPYVLNFYKTSEDGTTPLDTAKFKVKTSDNKFVKTSGTGSNGCYIYNGTTTVENEGTTFDTTGGEACIVKIPDGTYTVEEITPADNHTFGSTTTKTITTSTSKMARTDLNKFVNYPTEVTFTKEVVGDYSSLTSSEQQILIDELKNLRFKVKSGNNYLSFVNVNGIYEYAGNTFDGPTGTPITELSLVNEVSGSIKMTLTIKHLPTGVYSLEEVENDGCITSLGNACLGNGFYLSDPVSFEVNNTYQSVTLTGMTNRVTQMTFTKNDIYGYEDSTDKVVFENQEEVKAFDDITFKIKDSNGNYLNLTKKGDVGIFGDTNSYAEYFYNPYNEGDGQTGTELHTYSGNIKINNLCRDTSYTIEEVRVPEGTVFVLPSTHPTVTINIPKQGDSTTNSNNKGTISDTPTRVVFQKIDSRDNTEIITDPTAEFEVYRCAKGQTTCTKDTSTEIMHFVDKAVIPNDNEENEEVYKAISSSDVASGTTGVTTLKLNASGKIILRYLPADYSYILYEKIAPSGYYDVVESSSFGDINFKISNSSISENVNNVPNYPTSIKFNKTDLYEYYSGLETTEASLFDTIKFRLYDGSGNLVALTKVQDGEYRYYNANGTHLGTVVDLYTKNAEITITHLDRNTTYYLEEYEVPDNSVFIEPNNIDNSSLPGSLANNTHPVVDFSIGNDTTTSTPQAVTNLIENLPTRVAFKKVDLNTSELVVDQDKRATFKIYQCPVTANICDENGTLIYFEEAEVISGADEDIIDGVARKAYKYSKNNDSTGKLSELKLDNGYLVLRYLPTDYKYVLVETSAPDGYYNPPTTEKYTEFQVLSTTLSNGETYALPGDVNNTPVEITFTKDDFYRYMDEDDVVEFESEDEIRSFDDITFVLKNANGTPVELCKTADETVDGKSISTYRFLNATCQNKVTELHTKNGKLKVTHLYRNTTYTVEETAVPTHSMFTLPSDHQTVSYTISTEGNVQTNRTNTKLMNDLPTRVLIYKKDDRTNSNIQEGVNKKETATFELYRCSDTSVACTKENTNEKVTFMKKAVLTISDIENDNDITDSDLGKEAYKFVSTSDLEAMSQSERVNNTTTTLELDSTGQILLRYLPANYKYVLIETNAPDGYYNYVAESLNDEVSVDVTNVGTNGTLYNFVNTHTEITFNKNDLYRYYTASDLDKLGSNTKIFDSMTFVLRDENGDIVKLSKVQDGEYRFIQNDGTYSGNTIEELHTKDGNMIITHLYRNETYYIEEVASDTEGNFILPNNVDNTSLVDSKAGALRNNRHPIVRYNIPNVIPNTVETRALTQLIENKPSRVVFEKRDAITGELIDDLANQDTSYPDVKTTFKVYQCSKTVDTCTIDNGALISFEAREYNQELTSDITSVTNPVYVYKYSKLNNGSITELNTDRGVLVLSYLPSDYKYVLYETVAPNGYYNPSTLEAQTEFEVRSTTLDTGETYEVLTSRVSNEPTEIFFEKKDTYDYYNGNDIAKLNSDDKIFDTMTFILRDKDGNILNLKCSANGQVISSMNGTCPTGEYRYLPYKDSENTITELHTKNGAMVITHLYKGETYYIEEVGTDNEGNFILPNYMTYTENLPFNYNGHLVVKYELQNTKPATNESVSKIMENIPTRVVLQKRDSKYGYLVDDETTTFKVYQCNNAVEKCTPENGTLVYFDERGTITGDNEDSGKEVYKYSKLNSSSGKVSDLHPYHGELILRYLPANYKYVFVETVPPKNYILPQGENAYTEFTIEDQTVEVESVDVPNKPTSLLIRKYGEDGSLLEGAQFKIYEGTTCDASVKPKDQPKNLLTLKTIRDGVYENREVKDTDTLITCTDKEGNKCSDITPSLTYDRYVDTWTNYNNTVNQNSEQISIQSGEILVQYLEYGHCYIIEEVKAPNGYSLPENEDDRFIMVTINKENDAVDTMKELVNKPTPFTFYKFDEYNNLIDGGEFKLQKLNSKKKYEDVTVSEEEIDGKLYYKVDPTTDNKKIVTLNGEATVYYLEKGQYRIVETKAPEGMELPIKEINVSIFYVDDDGHVTGNAIITNKPKTEKIVIKPQASAELIVTISTGMKIVNYGVVIAALFVVTMLLVLVLRKRKDA